MSSPNELARQQRALQQRILSGDTNHVESQSAASRVEVYAHAYRARLVEALAHNFPMLEQYLHHDEFVHIALDYLSAHPSTSISVRDVGVQLAEWLADHCAGQPWLAEFARFEWALSKAFDAIDSTIVRLDDVGAVAREDWPQMTFAFTAATQRLTLYTNAPQLYRAVASEDAIPIAHELSSSCEWLIWRRDTTAQYRSLTALEALAFDTLFKGGTFSDACEAMFEHGGDEQIASHAAAFLKRWIEDELIAAHGLDTLNS